MNIQIMTDDVKRLLVDTGFDFANSTANSEIQNSICSNNCKYFMEQNQIQASH